MKHALVAFGLVAFLTSCDLDDIAPAEKDSERDNEIVDAATCEQTCADRHERCIADGNTPSACFINVGGPCRAACPLP